jgi:hypothetical protein
LIWRFAAEGEKCCLVGQTFPVLKFFGVLLSRLFRSHSFDFQHFTVHFFLFTAALFFILFLLSDHRVSFHVSFTPQTGGFNSMSRNRSVQRWIATSANGFLTLV